MLLKKLEAYGFKSFADKLDLEFGPGITAVVGPNGSGKSNITEAIRWVLGEQSAKNLRGHKMEDVIFIGSERRKPLGIAEVSITLDNYDNKLPLEFSEVTITRRVFRSGESEFFINKVPCRLKDIYELFSDTGLGREALSVISQNQVDDVLNSRPEERRTIFEEAAGITKYKNRKREAVRRLDETQQNLLRVRDILNELEIQITPLEEAAGKAEQYLALENRFKQLDIEVICHKIHILTVNVESIQRQCDDLEDKLAASNAQLAKAEAEKETAQYDLGKLENQCQEMEAQIQELNLELQQLDSNIMLAQERMRNYQEKRQQMNDDIGEYDAKMAGVQQEIAREQAQIKLIQEKLSAQQQSVVVKEGLAREITNRINEAAQQVSASKDAVLDRMQLLAKKRNNLHSIRTEGEMARRTLDKLSREADENQALIEHALAQLQTCSEKRVATQNLLCQTDELTQEKQKQQSLLLEQQNQVINQGEDTQKKSHDLSSRFKVLQDMQKVFEGYSLGVKAIMSKEAAWSANICGIVADLLQVPVEYTLAVEVALGNALQNIVTEDAETAKAAIAYLKQSHQGRATLLPLDVIKAASARDYEINAANSPGALGFAVDLVSFDQKYKEAMNYLLGRIIIAKNMDAAFNIARKSGFRSRVVTLDGDLISPGGAMTGGSQSKKGSGLLGRKRELQDLEAAIAKVRQEWQDNRDQLLIVTNQLEESALQIQLLQEQRQQEQIEIAGLEKECEQLTQEKNRLEKMHRVLGSEMDVQKRTIDEVEGKINQASAEISALELSDRETQEAIQLYQKDVEQQQLVLQQVNNEITETKILLAAVEQEKITADRMIERLLVIQNTHEKEKQDKLDEIAEIEGVLAQLAEDVEKGQNTKAGIVARQDDQTALLHQHKTQRYQIVANLGALEKSSRELRRGNQELQSKLHELQLKRTHYTYEYETDNKYLAENYGCAWTEELQQKHKLAVEIEEAEAVLVNWRDELKAMGPVNVTAIEEYERIRERFNFLTRQAEDLEQAQVSLHQVIAEMDGTMRKRFIDSFQCIAREFTVVFGELFGGGHAELQLTNKEEVLETGIDIIAQPPGKKLQNLSLLSGGERALTVISLLFAMLRVKPTPFCVVDEIDAALDEANVSRFAHFLSGLSQNSQFIVITHRKGTMEYANVLHGITMEEQGVSKMISVKFMDQAG